MSTEVAGFGENYASGVLEREGWIVCLPTRDIGVDRVAFKIAERFKYLFIQVKTATWKSESKYTIRVEKSKTYYDPHFIFIFVLEDLESRVQFLVLTTDEWKEVMGKSLRTASWVKRGTYTFHIPKDLGKWKRYLNAFKKLDEI